MTDAPRSTVRALLDGQVADGHLPGYAAAVRRGGQVEVLTGGVLTLGEDRPVLPDTPFRLSSVTKVFAAVLALSFVEDGTLALDDEVRCWLPELAEPRVLRHMSGPHAPEVAPDEYVRRLLELPLAAQPGSTWLHHTGSDLLGVLLARSTGRAVSDLLAERVTGPLGLTSTGFWTAGDRLPTAYQPEGPTCSRCSPRWRTVAVRSCSPRPSSA